MNKDLIERIRAEISIVEAAMDEQKRALEKSANADTWEMEVNMRSLGIRLTELQRNLQVCEQN